MSYVSEQLEHLKKLNSNEPEFIQAATEVLTTLEPVIEANPQYEAAGILERLTEPERQIMRAIAEGREERDMTQKQLAEATGITQADISRLESGTGNPSLRTLKRLAAGMGMALKVEFVPLQP